MRFGKEILWETHECDCPVFHFVRRLYVYPHAFVIAHRRVILRQRDNIQKGIKRECNYDCLYIVMDLLNCDTQCVYYLFNRNQFSSMFALNKNSYIVCTEDTRKLEPFRLYCHSKNRTIFYVIVSVNSNFCPLYIH